MKRSEAFIGLDVHKETIAVAIADSGRTGEVRYWGTMPNTMHHLGQLVTDNRGREWISVPQPRTSNEVISLPSPIPHPS
jgi:hypothetical protein